MENKKSILVKGAYGEANFGDDALMHVIHNIYIENKYNDKTFYLVNKDFQYIPTIINNINLITKPNLKISDYFLVIFGGGTQFFSFKSQTFLHYIKYIIDLVLKFLNNLFSESEDDKIVQLALGVGIGPFKSVLIEKKAKNYFKKIDFSFVRDVYSFEKLRKWNIDNIYHYTDLCYSYENDNFKIKESNEIKKIGVIVRDWRLDEKGGKYKENIIDFVKEKRSENYIVTFIIFSRIKDYKWIEELSIMNEVILLWEPRENSLDEFINSLSKFDLFITGRYHGAVFSTLLRIPFISIEVDPKLQLLSNIFFKSSKNWCYPFKKEVLNDNFDLIEKDYLSYKRECDLEVKKQILLAKDMEIRFKNLIKLNFEK